MQKIWKIERIEQMKSIGKIISSLLFPNTLLFLTGELGSGKTTLTKFISRHLNIKSKIQSPTFSILKQYPICFNKKRTFFNHFDLFRLKKEKELIKLLKNLKELTFENINVIEWGKNDPDFYKWIKTPGFLIIQLEIRQINDKRIIKIKY